MRFGAPITAVVAALLATGCLYTDGINAKPEAHLLKQTPGPHFIGSVVTLQAFDSTDLDGDDLRATWVAIQCADMAGDVCTPDTGTVLNSQTLTTSADFSFTVNAKTPVFVSLTVEDDRGATGVDWTYVEVQNQDPVITDLQRTPVGASYTLGTTVTVTAKARDDDGDAPLYYSARPLAPRGVLPEEANFGPPVEITDGMSWEIRPDVAGIWEVEVTVRDGTGTDAGEVVDSIPILFVDDEAPCVVGTDPLAVVGGSYIVDTAGGVRRFAVTNITDDLDPYPAGTGPEQAESTFRWFIASPDTDGAFVEVTANVGADFVVDPAAYAPGDMLKIRVEVADRVDRGSLPCADDAGMCSYTSEQSCPQRVTWEAEIR